MNFDNQGSPLTDSLEIVLVNEREENFIGKTERYFPRLNTYPVGFQSADFNGEGLIDLFICGFRGPDKLFFRNRN